MNRTAIQEVVGLDIEQQIASLNHQVQMNLATPLLDEKARQGEIEILNRLLAKAQRVRENAKFDRNQYSCTR